MLLHMEKGPEIDNIPTLAPAWNQHYPTLPSAWNHPTFPSSTQPLLLTRDSLPPALGNDMRWYRITSASWSWLLATEKDTLCVSLLEPHTKLASFKDWQFNMNAKTSPYLYHSPNFIPFLCRRWQRQMRETRKKHLYNFPLLSPCPY